MGCIDSKPLSEVEQKAVDDSHLIDMLNDSDYEEDLIRVKMLLLGAGESGKSTVTKQMRMLHGEKYTHSELLYFKICIHHNVVEFIESLCDAMILFYPEDEITKSKSFLLIRRNCAANQNSALKFRKYPELNEDYVIAMKEVWSSKCASMTFDRRSEFQLIENTSLFIESIDKIVQSDFLPNAEQIVNCRYRTSGMREEKLIIDNQHFSIFDVGGQRNERRKWIKLFDGVHALIFMVALSEFDQHLRESTFYENRMLDSLNTFEQYVNEPAFDLTTLILFLNKDDLFKKKIKKVDISSIPCFSDYQGKKYDYHDGLKYFIDKFLARNYTDKKVKVHVTTATNQENVRVCFEQCKDDIIQRCRGSSIHF